MFLILPSAVFPRGWRRSSVVTMSTFGLRNFSDIRLICGWQCDNFVGILSAMGSSCNYRPTQSSIPPGSVNEK